MNIFDAFPEDPLKNTDVDHDGIDDSEDSEIIQFIPAYKKYLDRGIFSNLYRFNLRIDQYVAQNRTCSG